MRTRHRRTAWWPIGPETAADLGRGCAVALLAALMTGCHSDPDVAASKSATAPASPDRSKLQPVALPNLSRSDPSVQKQLREGYAALTAKMADPNATDVELGFAYGDMGKLLLAAEFRDAAEPNFLNAQTLTPNEVRWPYYLGHLYKVKGDSSRASASFERALQLQPDDLATLVWLGNIYLDQGRFPEAQPLFERAFAIQPRSPAVLFGMGRAALARQEYAKTVEYLEQVLSLDPNAIVVHYPLAMAYRGLGDIQKAEAHLQARGPGEVRPPDPLMKQIETLLESAVAYEVRGADALDERQWDAAAEYFRKGIALAPNEPSLRHKLGTALAMKGDAEGAVSQFEEVTRRWPKFAKAHYSLGVILAASGHLPRALEQLSAAVDADPTYSEARLQLAEGLRMSGRFRDSLTQYEAVITLNPRLAEARLGYALSLANLKRFEEARTQLSEGARIYPERHEFAELLARLPPVAPGRP